jgi:hypothetical protein
VHRGHPGAQRRLGGVPIVAGTGGQLLLWLYDRHGDPGGDADDSGLDPELRQRFRGLCFTD